MGNAWKLLFVLLSVVGLFVIGGLLFANGFLLKRLEIHRNSTCFESFIEQRDVRLKQTCWLPGKYSKAITIIIDALRFDFMTYNESLSSVDAKPYQNKLPILYQLLSENPYNGRLYRFIADPPTTTLQRIKGLTTGSLPTFVDAGSNFASYEITEDNFIDQLVKQDKFATFLGDDTWMGLFPSRFSTVYPFPSFNIKDLHTVDNGINDHLLHEINRNDWHLIIAHYLGVDHCGHRFGPNHPAMDEKLTQMNQVISDVVKALDDETVLFILGDHGMTRTGDHGGDSADELETGLFVYSHKPITSVDPQMTHQTVSQIDLVPTISLLLELPVPFSNLGMVITDLFSLTPDNSQERQAFYTLKALRLNAQQISSYLSAYSRLSEQFPQSRYMEFQNILRQSEVIYNELFPKLQETDSLSNASILQVASLEEMYTSYIKSVQEMCRAIWARFDLISMMLGVMIVVSAILISIRMLNLGSVNSVLSNVTFILPLTVIVSLFSFLQCVYLQDMTSSLLSALLCTFSLLLNGFMLFKSFTKLQNKDASLSIMRTMQLFLSRERLLLTFSLVICALSFGSYFSNSFVVYEDAITTFLVESLILVYFVVALQNIFDQIKMQITLNNKDAFHRKKKERHSFDVTKLAKHPGILTFILAMSINICFILASNFRACREEQWTCEESPFLQSLATLGLDSPSFRNFRYMFSILCLSLVVFLSKRLLKYYGNLNGYSPAVFCVKHLFPLSAICIGFYWALQTLPQKLFDSLPSWQHIIFPLVVYLLLAITLVCLLLQPLCIYLLPNKDDALSIPYALNTSQENRHQVVIPQVFKQLKENFQKKLDIDNSGEGNERHPVVYGLSSAYSASVCVLSTVMCLLLMLLLRDGLAPSALMILISMLGFLELYTVTYPPTKDNIANWSVPWSAIVTWSLSMNSFFYATGHQASINTIQWEAAYTGFHSDFNNQIIPTILLIFNTFGAQIIYTITCPLLIFWPFIGGKVVYIFSKQHLSNALASKAASKSGDFYWSEHPDKLAFSLFRLCLGVMLFQAIKLFASMCAAAILRRHLMVWKIFAPRFIFEAVTSFTVFTCCILSYLFVIRVHHALDKWFNNLKKSS